MADGQCCGFDGPGSENPSAGCVGFALFSLLLVSSSVVIARWRARTTEAEYFRRCEAMRGGDGSGIEVLELRTLETVELLSLSGEG